MKIENHTLNRALTSSFCLLLTTATAFAEGGDVKINGVHGVVRIVLSKPNHLKTSAHVRVDFYQPVNAAGRYDYEVNPTDNKPSPYLGGSVRLSDGSTTEVDAGVQFETNVFKPTSVGVGFSAFIARAYGGGNTYVNPKWWDGTNANPWRGGSPVGVGRDATTGSYEGDLSFTMIPANTDDPADSTGTKKLPAGSRLYVSNLGQQEHFFYWNPALDPTKNPEIRPGPENPLDDKSPIHWVAPWLPNKVGGIVGDHAEDQSQARVKHESAVTRRDTSNDFTLDGSNTTITYTQSKIGGSLSNVAPDGRDWTNDDVEQTRTNVGGVFVSKTTGFSAPANGRGDTIWDKRDTNGHKTSLSRTIVEFIKPDAAPETQGVYNVNARQSVVGAGSNTDNATRYINETVRINLGTVTQPQGNVMEWEAP